MLAHEKTGDYDESQHAGSVVWISHAGKLLRCSPEQLRHVMHDVRELDRTINGPQNFHTLLEQIAKQQRYADISQEGLEEMHWPAVPSELQPHFRARGKRPLSELRAEDAPDSQSHGPKEPRLEEVVGPEDPGELQSAGSGLRPGESRGPGRCDPQSRKEEQGQELPGDLRDRRRVQPMGDRSCGGEFQGQGGSGTLRSLPVSTTARGFQRGEISEASRKRKSSGTPPGSDGPSGKDDYQAGTGRGRRPRVMGQSGRDGDELTADPDQHVRDESTHAGTREQHDPSVGISPAAPGEDGSSREVSHGHHRLRSRSPYPTRTEPGNESANSTNLVSFAASKTAATDTSELHDFISYVDQLDVLEMELSLAPRDVHKKKGCWVVNAKAKKNVEVVLRKLSKQEQDQFDEAMQKELDSFLSADAVQICASHGIPQERIMQMRWIYTWKPVMDEKGVQTGRKAKARLIVKGFQDPRLMHLPREAPTLSCLGRNLLLSNAARNEMPVCTGDIKTAFLQGDETEKHEDIFGMPPPEVRIRLQMRDDEILRIVRAVYGLLNAPKRWYEALTRFLIDDGWVIHSLDKCLFKRVHGNNVVGYLGVHVDDVLCAGKGYEYEQAISRLRSRFPFGAWECAQDTSVTYCGCEIKQDADFTIHVTQERFALSIDEINLSKERRCEVQEEVTFEERRLLRQTLGALNWRATQSSPWLLATVSHLQGCLESATIADVLSVNKLVRLQRKNFCEGLHFPVIRDDVTIVSFTDASWATRRDGSSQGGQITLLMGKTALTGAKTPFCVLSWSSKRLRRVARSSTSAEAQMSANALDSHEFAKLAQYDLNYGGTIQLKKADDYLSSFESGLICDARNIYDGIVKVETSGLKMEEKRTAIELLAIKERLNQAQVTLKWVDGDQEMADGLTKPWRHEPLLKAMRAYHWRIVYDPEVQSARRKRALRYQNPVVSSVDDQYWLHCLFSLDVSDARRVFEPW